MNIWTIFHLLIQQSNLTEGNYYIDTDIMGIVEPNVKGLILGNPMHYNAKSEYLLGQLFGRKLVGLI